MPIPTDTQSAANPNMIEPVDSTDQSGSLHFQAPDNNKKEQEDTTPAAPMRRVSFHGRVKCRRSHALDPDACWYSADELAIFRKQDKQLQQLVAVSGKKNSTTMISSFVGDDDSEEVSYVGLASEKERRRRIQRMKEAKACVLAEQLQQEEQFYSNEKDDISQSFKLDHESIAEFFSIYSKKATKVAHRKALQVSWHVENLWREDADEPSSGEEEIIVDAGGATRSCNRRSTTTSGSCPVRNSSIRSAGSLISRLATAT